METVISYAKEAAEAFKYYVSINGIDETSKKIYQYIQDINSLNEEEKNELDVFISDYTVDNEHVADIVYMTDNGREGLFKSLNRMKPFVSSKPSERFYEARGEALQIVKNNDQKTVKVIKRTYPKKAA